MSVRFGSEVPLILSPFKLGKSQAIPLMQYFPDFIKAIFSGFVEGITEFLPVSSTAHLLIFSWLVDFNSIQNNLFEIVIQFGAILAVIIIYRVRIFSLILEWRKKNNQKLILNLFLSFLPAAFIGLLFHDFIKKVLFSNFVIACALIFGGLAMLVIDRKERKFEITNIDEVSPIKAFFIGCFQSMAIIPGISRSGATIIGGLLLKLNRQTAAEFSFFLSIPTIAAATFYDLYKNYQVLTLSGFELIIVGFLSAFISAILVIKWFISYISKHNFISFAIYRIALGVLILFFIL